MTGSRKTAVYFHSEGPRGLKDKIEEAGARCPPPIPRKRVRSEMRTQSRTTRRATSVVAAIVAALLLLAACGDDDTSPEDQAREDGQALGESIAGLGEIQLDDGSIAVVAVGRLRLVNDAADELLSDRADVLSDQVDEVTSIIDDTIDAMTAALREGNLGDASDALDAGLTELDATVDELSASNDAVAQAAWEGVQSGLESGGD